MFNMSGLRKGMKRFARETDGSATVEFVLWFPLVIIVFALLANVTMMFYSQNEVLRAIQDGNRNMSVGRFETTLENESYIEARIAGLLPNARATSTVNSGVVTTIVTYPASDVIFLNAFNNFSSLRLSARADHYIEDWDTL